MWAMEGGQPGTDAPWTGPRGDEGEREGDAGEAQDLEWERLRALWLAVPEPEWDEARAERIFQAVMRRIARRERWRTIGRAAAVAAALGLPLAVVIAVRAARAHA